MICPECGDAELVRDTRDLSHTYKGRATVIPRVSGRFCPACGEVLLGPEEAKRYGEAARQLHLQVDAGEPSTSEDTIYPIGDASALGPKEEDGCSKVDRRVY